MGENKALVVLAMIISLLAMPVGCGGSDENSVTKNEFLKRAKIACQQGEREREEAITRVLKEFPVSQGEATRKEKEEAAALLVPHYERTTEKLSDIGLPEGEEAQVEDILQAREDATAKVQEEPLKLIGGEPFKEASKLMKAYGLDESCMR